MEIREYIADIMLDTSVPIEFKHRLVEACSDGQVNVAALKTLAYRPDKSTANNDEMGYFGGIWIRKLFFSTTEVLNLGHSHDFDHVTLLATGSMKVDVDGEISQLFTAPTFIVIRKNTVHNLLPQEPNTLAFCLHSFRNSIEGQQEDIEAQLKSEGLTTEEFFADGNDPLIKVL